MTIETLLAKANESFNAGRAFGPVIDGGDCLVVPVAFTAGGGGGGEDPKEEGGPLGGGFGGVSWPLGVYVIKDGNVRWVPAVDVTRVALGAMALVRTVIRMRTMRARRRPG